jgi:ribonuclease HII
MHSRSRNSIAVILPKVFSNKYLNDSKKLSEKKRLDLKTIIEKRR